METSGFKKIAVFCGASMGNDEIYAAAAREMGKVLVSEGIGLVYGGGTVGLMGEIARQVAEQAGKSAVYGVIPRALAPREVSGELIGEIQIVEDMHTRKALMAQAADGFIGLPGGFGTLEELLEVITWQQLGFHAKPVGLLNINGFYNTLMDFFNHCVSQGFIRPQHNTIIVDSDPRELLRRMKEFKAPESLVEQAKKANLSKLA